jgi:NADH-quinone oxidoreductase subunit K
MTTSVPLTWVLLLGAALFCIGLFGLLTRRTTIGALLGVEIMLTAVNITLVAFWRYFEPQVTTGQLFALFVIVVAAAEAAVGLAMVVSIYRARRTVTIDDVDVLRG